MLTLTALEQRHLATLAKWRGAMDLVGPGPLEPHFEDAARAVAWLEEPTGVWADLGSGAGFPGVALAARHPQLTVHLVESRQKRATFLRQLKAGTVLCARSESLSDASYDGVISRAYRPPPDFLADALRLLKPGGMAVLMLARQEPPQVEGLQMFHVEHYEVEGRPRQAVGYLKP